MKDGPAFRRAGMVVLWLVTIWETLTMGIAGLGKFASPDVWSRWFDSWGYPGWLMTLVGATELLGALLLLLPRVAPYASVSLLAIMFGALFTVLTKESGDFTAGPVAAHLVGLSVVAWFRRPVWARQGSRRRAEEKPPR